MGPKGSKKKYIIGSRGSLLALTQTHAVKKELETATGLEFDVEVIKTQGDIQTNKPLWQLKGENFFTRELDEALLAGDVDLVVHSFKDLGGIRPEGITLAAVPKRNYPNDILLIKKETLQSLPEMKKMIIGTSSPRRIYLVEKLLHKLIPYGKKIKFETAMLRGNVNTRLQKLQNGEFDAIILALAGLERLASSPESKKELKNLTEELDFMLLPVSEFTPAAAQGALALECLKKNKTLLEKIALISDESSKKEALREKELFAYYGGGCHQAVGVHVRSHPQGQMEIHRGIKGEKEISQTEFISSKKKTEIKVSKDSSLKAFIGLPPSKALKEEKDTFLYDEISIKEYIKRSPAALDAHFLVTSNHCVGMLKKVYNSGTVWTSGVKTMMTLAEEKFWVNGCADFAGVKEIENFSRSKFLRMLIDSECEWRVLTSHGADSNFAPTISCYKRKWKKATNIYKKKIQNCEAFYWTSFPQYEAFIKEFPEIEEAKHACGLGKTLDEFNKSKIKVIPFASHEEFKEWFYEQTK